MQSDAWEQSHRHHSPPCPHYPGSKTTPELPLGPSGHLVTISSVISLTEKWPYYSCRGTVFRETVLSQQQHVSHSCISTHTHTAVYLHICTPQRKLSTCPHLIKTQWRPRVDTHNQGAACGTAYLAHSTASKLGMAFLCCRRGRSSSSGKLCAN